MQAAARKARKKGISSCLLPLQPAPMVSLPGQPPKKGEACGCTGDVHAGTLAHLGSLPGQPAYEQVDQAVSQHLEVIPPRCLPPQMLVDAGIAHCATEVLGLLLISHMEAAGATPFACCRANTEGRLGVKGIHG